MSPANSLRGLLCLLPLTLHADPIEGQAEYEMNCKACHLIDTTLVGPSLIEIAKTYPEDRLADFLKWTKTPGKKNPRMIQMPSMAHLPDESLAKVHRYLLKATEGKEEQKRSALFEKFKEPKRALPYVTRGFLPDTSPASVAVILKDNLSVAWNTETCRLDYLWEGEKTNFGDIFGPARLPNKPFYHETSDKLWSFINAQPDYLGYRLIEGYPEFHYRLGTLEIRELVSNGPKPGTVTRKFTLSSPSSATLDLTNEGKATLTSDQGTLKDGKLALSGTTTFTLTLTRK